MTKYILLLSCLIIMTGCLLQEQAPKMSERDTELVSVSINACSCEDNPSVESKSTVGKQWDDKQIKSLLIAVYMDNILYDSRLVSSGAVNMELPDNKEASIYAFANMTLNGNRTNIVIPKTEDQMQEIHLKNIDLEHLDGCPLVGHSKTTIRNNTTINLIMTRLVSRIDFSIDKQMLSNLKVKEVSFHQTPTDIHPFKTNSAATAVSSKGDYSSFGDINILNSGGVISLYMLENCQGVLLPDNTDPWQKIPDNLGNKANLCTYLEAKCNLMADSDVVSEVTYRFYLGKDNTGDFNIVRNTANRITLFATKDGLNKSSWRVEVNKLLNLKAEITIPDYAQQFGCIKIPKSIANGRQTVVKIGNESITMGSMESFSKTIDGLSVEYVPSCTTTELYFMKTIKNCNGTPTTISVTNPQFPEIDTVLTVNPEIPVWKFRTKIDGTIHEIPSDNHSFVPAIIISEDGYDHLSYDVVLCDKDDMKQIPKRVFYYPDAISQYYNFTEETSMTNIFNLYVKSISIGNDNAQNTFDNIPEFHFINTANLSDPYIVGTVNVYGLNTMDLSWHRNMGFFNKDHCSLPVPDISYSNIEQKLKLWLPIQNLQIIPAFTSTYELFGDSPLIYHLYTNEVLKSKTGDTNNIYCKKMDVVNTQKAKWTIAASDLHYRDNDFKTIYESCKHNFRTYSLKNDLMEIGIENGYSILKLGHPDYSSDMSQQAYFPYGTYLIRGEVTNPFTKRKIVGTVLLTLKMYIPLSFQVEKLESSNSRTDFYVTMVPFSKGYTTNRNTVNWWHRQCLDKIRYSAYSSGNYNSPNFVDWVNVSSHGRIGRGFQLGSNANNFYVGYINNGRISADYQSLQSILKDSQRGIEYSRYLSEESKIIYHSLFNTISTNGVKKFSTFTSDTFGVKDHDYFEAEIVFDGEFIEYKFKDSINY